MNEATITGNLGRDAELRYTPTGRPVANFSVAVEERFTRASGEKVKDVLWVEVEAWGKLAETAQRYFKVGTRVLVKAKLLPVFVNDNGKGYLKVKAQYVEVQKWPDDGGREVEEDDEPDFEEEF